jgi:hypothetical protein
MTNVHNPSCKKCSKPLKYTGYNKAGFKTYKPCNCKPKLKTEKLKEKIAKWVWIKNGKPC